MIFIVIFYCHSVFSVSVKHYVVGHYNYFSVIVSAFKTKHGHST